MQPTFSQVSKLREKMWRYVNGGLVATHASVNDGAGRDFTPVPHRHGFPTELGCHDMLGDGQNILVVTIIYGPTAARRVPRVSRGIVSSVS